jgi:hypothetical protein
MGLLGTNKHKRAHQEMMVAKLETFEEHIKVLGDQNREVYCASSSSCFASSNPWNTSMHSSSREDEGPNQLQAADHEDDVVNGGHASFSQQKGCCGFV